MPHHRHASSSSYAPVLINPSPDPTRPCRASIDPPRSVEPKLRYPYPLPLLACFDLGYTLYHINTHSTSWIIVALCFVRCFVLLFVVGCSKRWRTRGGWVAVVCGLSVGLAVWTLCKGQLEKGKPAAGGSTTSVHALFLGVTAGIAIAEYITFLLLLRLSPPHHRSNPLALRLPPSAVQSPTAFTYQTETLAESAPPTPIHARIGHFRHSSRHTLLQPGSIPRSTISYHDDTDEEAFDEEMAEEGYSDDASSISESSIIDLPPPMAPSRVAPSLSVNRGLDIIAAIDQTPVIGAVVRRTKSARFLGRSWGSRNGDEEGYGTFDPPPSSSANSS